MGVFSDKQKKYISDMTDPQYIAKHFAKPKQLNSVIWPEISLPTMASQKLTGAILWNLPIEQDFWFIIEPTRFGFRRNTKIENGLKYRFILEWNCF